jgi:DNA-binding Lrp family transcriptional regulator
MFKGSTILHLSREHAYYFTVPDPIFELLCKSAGELNATKILVYLQLLRLWRFEDYQLELSNRELASQLGLSLSTVRRAIESLQKLGLIVRKTRKLESTRGTKFNDTSLTHPGAPEALLEHLRSSPMRKPYRDKKLDDITTFDEVLSTLKLEKPNQSKEREITPEVIKDEIRKLLSAGQIRADLYVERDLTKQVEWSIFSGHLSDEKYENDQKRLKIALRLIKNEEWSKPSGMPKVYC